MKQKVKDISQRSMEAFEYLGLLVIAIATIIAASADVGHMMMRHAITLGDLLMMFLYLEVLSMVRHYISTGTMPVRYPLYIGIVALTRFLVLDIKELTSLQVLSLAAATLLLALAVLVVRYGHARYPYTGGDDGNPEKRENIG